VAAVSFQSWNGSTYFNGSVRGYYFYRKKNSDEGFFLSVDTPAALAPSTDSVDLYNISACLSYIIYNITILSYDIIITLIREAEIKNESSCISLHRGSARRAFGSRCVCMWVWVCVCVYMDCNDIIYMYIYTPFSAIHQLSHEPRRKGWLKYYYCYAARSRFSPVDVSSIVVPVRIIVIILYLFISMYKSFPPLLPPTLQSLNPIYRLFMAPRLFCDAAPTIPTSN